MDMFEEEYKDNMDQEAAILLGLKALKKATEEAALNVKAIEIGLIRAGETFRRLDESEVEKYISKIA
jgi:proteasome alpha subunit